VLGDTPASRATSAIVSMAALVFEPVRCTVSSPEREAEIAGPVFTDG
jgi:hypothetical protein